MSKDINLKTLENAYAVYGYQMNSCDGKYGKSLDVRTTRACDNSCGFCIEKAGLDSLGISDIPKMIENTIKSGKREVLLLGGEPMLLGKRLLEYIKGVRNHVDKIFITSSLPKNVNLENDYIVEILDLIDGLNCSVHHYNPSFNNFVLRASSNHDRLELLSKLTPKYGHKIRVLVNLVKGFIDSKTEIDKMVDTLISIGVKEVKFNELQHCDESLYVSFEKVYGVKMLEPFAFGCQTVINDVINKDINVILKRTCKYVNPTNKEADTEDQLRKLYLYEMLGQDLEHMQVMYENGDVYDGWVSDIDVITLKEGK